MNLHEGSAPPTPAEQLIRLKVIVEHVGKMWTAVLHRHTYLHSMSRNAELGASLGKVEAVAAWSIDCGSGVVARAQREPAAALGGRG
jgi:hypothetical protein